MTVMKKKMRKMRKMTSNRTDMNSNTEMDLRLVISLNYSMHVIFYVCLRTMYVRMRV